MSGNCDACNIHFTRAEHLRRHMNSVHNKDRIYRCEYCQKAFRRADSCRRHKKLHEIHGGDSRELRAKRIKKACNQCIQARTRCSGQPVCHRCEEKHLECEFAAGIVATIPEVEAQSDAIDQSIFSQEAIIDQSMMTAPLQVEQAGIMNLTSSQIDFGWGDSMNWQSPLNDEQFPFPLELGPEFMLPFPPQTSNPSEINNSGSPVASNRSSSHATSRTDHLSKWVDGGQARGTLQRSHKIYQGPRPVSRSLDDSGFSFPVDTGQSPGMMSGAGPLSDGMYNILVQRFEALCCSGPFVPFVSGQFPSLQLCNDCLRLYRNHFIDQLPFIHDASWNAATSPWYLTLAMITIGSSLLTTNEIGQLFSAFTEFLRRAMKWTSEIELTWEPLSYAQANLLHMIAQYHCGSHTAQRLASAQFRASYQGFADVRSAPIIAHGDTNLLNVEAAWRSWIIRESEIRLLWYGWFVDVLCSGNPYRLPPQDLALPCPSHIWSAPGASVWSDAVQTEKHTPTSITLHEALQDLYINHRIPPKVKEDTTCLLTYVILARTDEVARSVRHALYDWTPKPLKVDHESQANITSTVPTSTWLPAHKDYAAWRNSACDCLDLIHWMANSRIAAAEGHERSEILHLHMARLLLLCPFPELEHLALQFAECTRHGVPLAQNISRAHDDPLIPLQHLNENIIKWIVSDCSKARLSLVHAGAIFWFCRRHATSLFFEPRIIYFATLVIYFFGLYTTQVGEFAPTTIAPEQIQPITYTPASRPAADSDESDCDDLRPTSILLDRPCDDELIQTFVRKGLLLKPKMSGAGDIRIARGGKVVLREGIKLLQRQEYATIAISGTYSATLSTILQGPPLSAPAGSSELHINPAG